MLHLIEEIGRPEQTYAFFSSQTQAHHPVEAVEVVHVDVGHEYIANARYLARGKGADVAQIKQQGAPLEQEIHKCRRIAKRSVDQPRMEHGLHGRLVFLVRSLEVSFTVAYSHKQLI